jgi:hypothetical protein
MKILKLGDQCMYLQTQPEGLLAKRALNPTNQDAIREAGEALERLLQDPNSGVRGYAKIALDLISKAKTGVSEVGI